MMMNSIFLTIILACFVIMVVCVACIYCVNNHVLFSTTSFNTTYTTNPIWTNTTPQCTNAYPQLKNKNTYKHYV